MAHICLQCQTIKGTFYVQRFFKTLCRCYNCYAESHVLNDLIEKRSLDFYII